MRFSLIITCCGLLLFAACSPGEKQGTPSALKTGPVRVLILGHAAEHHPSRMYYPMLQEALGREAIYFDYVESVESALDNADYLNRFDALLLYANHETITPNQWKNLKGFVEAGGGFLPIHCASWCFQNEPGYDQLVGGRFEKHKTGVFKVHTVDPEHPAVRGVPELETWDETYVHKNHNEKNRTILQVREVSGPDDNITRDEPWTWVRTEGKGRVFYTASGHDERVWSRPEFHTLLKAGILWAIGDARRQSYDAFISSRTPLTYEKRDNIPNYENRPEPLPYQHPLTPEESMTYTRVPVGFRLELFASEPDIINPICMAWDERGRLWVAETVDYPNELTPSRRGRDSIKILEDTDGDWNCDKVTVFATGLNIPTSMVFSNGGLIVAHAPDFLFLKDTDGDDVADVREVLNTGWGTRDTHAGPSNLHYGFDNHIWGTVGYSGYEGPVLSGANKFGQGVYKMNPDGSDLVFLHQFNNNTWGLGFNETGEVFGSTANNNPAFFGGFPATGYRDNPGMSAKMIADTPTFFPITPNIRQVDAFGNYTAGAGYALAISANFPESWRNRMAFISGPTGDLLGMYLNEEDGSGYRAINQPSVIASADEWFSPVSAEVGPDGNLWVADWYNFIIQHNPTPTAVRGGYDAATGTGNAHVNPNRDRQHGRIYRLIWEGAPDSEIKSLAGASNKVLVATLGD
ncbi:MAG: ThuA domain-containing protein, partial [Verrucomicrobiae bacterium]|nr:ThuA domain-containing protein [Verrucomicrobiae bacterium]